MLGMTKGEFIVFKNSAFSHPGFRARVIIKVPGDAVAEPTMALFWRSGLTTRGMQMGPRLADGAGRCPGSESGGTTVCRIHSPMP